MLDYRNEQQAGHILTIEDPIEFIHSHKKSLISQRELGLDTHTYAKALRSSVRESPDVILIGELRDLETMEAALELCNTGHLTISTMHASNSYQTLQRIVNLFPETRHRELFMDLSLNLVGIISQRLVMGKDQKRVPAVEVLVNTPYVADLVLKGKIDELKEAMKTSTVKGMQNFDSSLIDLYKAGKITYEEALQNADSRTNLDARINFG
jgi:twitching motility protein PilU